MKNELEYQDIKVKELAAKTGINRKTLDNYLTKSANDPSVTNAVKIARVLNVSVEYLVTGTTFTIGQPQPSTSQEDITELTLKFKQLPHAYRKIALDLINSLLKIQT